MTTCSVFTHVLHLKLWWQDPEWTNVLLSVYVTWTSCHTDDHVVHTNLRPVDVSDKNAFSSIASSFFSKSWQQNKLAILMRGCSERSPKHFGARRQLETGALLSAVKRKVETKQNPVLMPAVILFPFGYARFWRPHKKTDILLWLS